jgi:hypothetical protein
MPSKVVSNERKDMHIHSLKALYVSVSTQPSFHKKAGKTLIMRELSGILFSIIQKEYLQLLVLEKKP